MPLISSQHATGNPQTRSGHPKTLRVPSKHARGTTQTCSCNPKYAAAIPKIRHGTLQKSGWHPLWASLKQPVTPFKHPLNMLRSPQKRCRISYAQAVSTPETRCEYTPPPKHTACKNIAHGPTKFHVKSSDGLYEHITSPKNTLNGSR